LGAEAGNPTKSKTIGHKRKAIKAVSPKGHPQRSYHEDRAECSTGFDTDSDPDADGGHKSCVPTGRATCVADWDYKHDYNQD